jgi:hypothetical protein
MSGILTRIPALVTDFAYVERPVDLWAVRPGARELCYLFLIHV